MGLEFSHFKRNSKFHTLNMSLVNVKHVLIFMTHVLYVYQRATEARCYVVVCVGTLPYAVSRLVELFNKILNNTFKIVI